jgi:hypothetical protein
MKHKRCKEEEAIYDSIINKIMIMHRNRKIDVFDCDSCYFNKHNSSLNKDCPYNIGFNKDDASYLCQSNFHNRVFYSNLNLYFPAFLRVQKSVFMEDYIIRDLDIILFLYPEIKWF